MMIRRLICYKIITLVLLLFAGISVLFQGILFLLNPTYSLLLPFISGLVKGGSTFPGFSDLMTAAGVVLVLTGILICAVSFWNYYKSIKTNQAEKKSKFQIDTPKNRFIVYFIILIAYASLGLFGLVIHEPWGDEAQSWLIARDCGFGEFFRQMSYEGSPGLWHLLLLPFAKLHFPYITQNIIHLLIAVSAVAFFLFRSPFPIVFKILLVFSYLIAYEYLVIARSYMLSVLILFALSSMYDQRLKKPIIYGFLLFLLINTNVHSFFAAFALMLFFIFDFLKKQHRKSSQLIGIVLIVAGSGLALLQLMPAPDNMHNGWMVVVKAPIFAVSNALIPRPFAYVNTISAADYVLFGLLFIGSLYFLRNPRWLLFLIISIGGLFYIYIFKDSGTARHQGFILIFLIFALWRSESEQNNLLIIKKRIFALLKPIIFFLIGTSMFISIFISCWFFINDYRYPFCGSKEMAAYMMDNENTCQEVVAHNSHPAIAVLPWFFGREFWYPAQQRYGTFVIWDKDWLRNENMNASEIISLAQQKTGGLDKTLFLFGRNTAATVKESDSLELLYKTSEPVFGYGDVFYLFCRK